MATRMSKPIAHFLLPTSLNLFTQIFIIIDFLQSLELLLSSAGPEMMQAHFKILLLTLLAARCVLSLPSSHSSPMWPYSPHYNYGNQSGESGSEHGGSAASSPRYAASSPRYAASSAATSAATSAAGSAASSAATSPASSPRYAASYEGSSAASSPRSSAASSPGYGPVHNPATYPPNSPDSAYHGSQVEADMSWQQNSNNWNHGYYDAIAELSHNRK